MVLFGYFLQVHQAMANLGFGQCSITNNLDLNVFGTLESGVGRHSLCVCVGRGSPGVC